MDSTVFSLLAHYWVQLVTDVMDKPDYCGVICVCAALAARAGAEHIRPALQRIYMTRASAYRDALKSFVEGYQEGVAEVMAKNAAEPPAKSEPTDSLPRKDKMPV